MGSQVFILPYLDSIAGFTCATSTKGGNAE
jgi:hypothetical protein